MGDGPAGNTETQTIKESEVAPVSLNSMSAERQEKTKETNWLYGRQEDLQKIESAPLKTLVTLLGNTPDSFLRASRLEELHNKVFDMTIDGRATEAEATPFLAKIAEKVETISQRETTQQAIRDLEEKQRKERVAEKQAEEDKRAAEVAEATRKHQERMEAMQKEATEAVKRQADEAKRAADEAQKARELQEHARQRDTQGSTPEGGGNQRVLTEIRDSLQMAGYDGFINAELSQAEIDMKLFDTQPQAWYRPLPESYKRIIRTRIGILSGCHVKKTEATGSLDAIFDCKDIRITKDSLAAMWRGEVPGFRVALATMIQEMFTYEVDSKDPLLNDPNFRFLTLTKSSIVAPSKRDNETEGEKQERLRIEKRKKEENKRLGLGRIANLTEYRDNLIQRLAEYFTQHPDLLGNQAPQLNPELAARAAFASAWNFLYLGNAIESGDVGRDVKNSEANAEQLRAMIRPLDKGKSKWEVGKEAQEDKVGTDEAWGGPLGDWMAERCRHNPDFKKKISEGEIKYFPSRMSASFFDLTTFGSSKNECPEESLRPIWGKTFAEIFTKICKPTAVNGAGGLYDFRDANIVNFNYLEDSELWGSYMDTMDSVRVIYRFLNGSFKSEVGIMQLSNALKKVRAEPLLKPVYCEPQVIAACIAAINGGPVKGSDELIIKTKETTYDARVTEALSEDRLFAGMSRKDAIRAKTEIFRILHAKNVATAQGELISFFGGMVSLASERERLRRKAQENLARVVAQSFR